MRSFYEGLELRPSVQAATLASVIQAKRKALNITGSDGDPVQYIQDNSPQFYAVVTEAESDPARRGAAADLLMFEQERLGVTPENRRVLSKSAAGAMAAELQALPGNERAQRIAELSAGYGDHSPRVAVALSDHGLDPASKALLRAKDDPVTAQELARMIDEGGHALRQGVDKEDLRVLSRSVEDALAGFDPANGSDASSFAANLSRVELAGVAKNLTLLYFRDSGDITTSAARAVRQLAPGVNVDVTTMKAGLAQAAGNGVADALRQQSWQNRQGDDVTLRKDRIRNSEGIGVAQASNLSPNSFLENGSDSESFAKFKKSSELEKNGVAGRNRIFDESPAPSSKDIGPPFTKPVRLKSLYEKLDFNPEGPNLYTTVLFHPIDAIEVQRLGEEAFAIADRHFPRGSLENDAIRHAAWNYLVTNELGERIAKLFGDAQEVHFMNADGGAKDLYNNNVGRLLALDPQNRGRLAEDVILESLRGGKLQVGDVIIMPEGDGNKN